MDISEQLSDWCDFEDSEFCAWAMNYLRKKKIPIPEDFAPSDFSKEFERHHVKAFFSSLGKREDAAQFSRRMQNAWIGHCYKKRKKSDGYVPVNYLMKRSTRGKLNKMAKESSRTQEEMISALIDESYLQAVEQKEHTKRLRIEEKRQQYARKETNLKFSRMAEGQKAYKKLNKKHQELVKENEKLKHRLAVSEEKFATLKAALSELDLLKIAVGLQRPPEKD